jgi:hypothetical protein
MNEHEKRQAIQEFFCAPEPRLQWKSILKGAAVACVGLLLLSANPSWFAFLVLCAGIGMAALRPLTPQPVPGVEQHAEPEEYFNLVAYQAARTRYESRPTGQQVLTWFSEDLDEIVRESYDNVGLGTGEAPAVDPALSGVAERVRGSLVRPDGTEIPIVRHPRVEPRTHASKAPLVVFGPLDNSAFTGFDHGMVRRRKLPESGAYMYSTWKIVVFHFTEYYVAAYQANYNMMKHVAVMEEVDEFFYRDVVAVKTTTESTNISLRSGSKMEHSKVFRLTASSGDHISVVLGGEGIRLAGSLESRNDENVQNIRTMLRTFKQAGMEGRLTT